MRPTTGKDRPAALAMDELAASLPPRRLCPYCHRVMSNREADGQGACNDCTAVA